ncbi:MAG: hypothetical protein KME26_11215 [Oscillatoria princeps RMCB-10]|jgi:cytoskeletal protein CcmA (bactofilin family)|nr:hypothetical protein [Oscillatoria princeps RMCB-10]
MATNYQQPEYVEKRLRYFDGQFLKDQDFIDEQKYHIDRQRRLSRILQVSGISEGLEVTSTAADTVSVAAGTAVDPKGRLIVLAQPQDVSVAGNRNQTVNLFISYQEVESDKAQEGSEGNRRWQEKPQIQAVAESGPAPQDSIKLAKLNIDKDGAIKVDYTVRQYSGVKLPAAGSNGPTLRSAGDSTAVLAGNLSVSGSIKAGSATINGALSAQGITGSSLSLGTGSITAGSATINGALTVTGNVGIGGASGAEKLEVTGNIKATGRITADGATINGHLTASIINASILSLGTSSITAGSATINAALTVTGNVGIGGTSGAEKLEVTGNIKATGRITAGSATINGALSASGITGSSLSLGTGSITAGSATINGVQTGTDGRLSIYSNTTANNSRAWLELWGKDDNRSGELTLAGTYIVFRSNSTETVDGNEQMRLTKEGNVGIGTKTPSEKLDVTGNIKATGSITAGSATINAIISQQLTLGSRTISETDIKSFSQVIVRGLIVMWFGDVNNIPPGWVLCDGNNGVTPDLRDKFIVGAGGNYSKGKQGGSESHIHTLNVTVNPHKLTIYEIPSHQHRIYNLNMGGNPDGWNDLNTYRHFWRTADYFQSRTAPENKYTETEGSDGSHDHPCTATCLSGGNLPPYYALVFIMKT